eukprot:scaffold26401_cov87-Skeletonema_dohrnii-CCMP3373.AAC.2
MGDSSINSTDQRFIRFIIAIASFFSPELRRVNSVKVPGYSGHINLFFEVAKGMKGYEVV